MLNIRVCVTSDVNGVHYIHTCQIIKMNIYKSKIFLKDIFIKLVLLFVYWQDLTHVFDSRGAGFQSAKEEGIDLF